MGNESGEWIMHGMNWDNPDCIHSVDEAIKYINEFGFLPLFKNDIDVFIVKYKCRKLQTKNVGRCNYIL